ncbi:MAG: transposase [Candidatus Velthaea sp.]
MEPVSRKVVYRMYPTRPQEAALLNMLGLHQRLYNAALEQRITAWRQTRTNVGFVQQCAGLTELRAADESYAALNAQSSQVTLKRLDLAFASFFHRVRSGETPGFPRFKAFDRFSGWGYKSHGDGFKFTSGNGKVSRLKDGARQRHGRLRLSGIGEIKVRGRARTMGEIATCEIQHKAGRWYASMTVKCLPKREGGTAAVGLDWGVETFATLAHEDGSFEAVANPRFFKKHRESVERAQKHLETTPKTSPHRKAAKLALGRAKGREASQRRDFLHQTSAAIIARVALLATEKLDISHMVKSAKGTIEEPGKNVAQKAGLNREILATSPASYHSMLRYKAEEAGSLYVETPTRTLKPSQRCSTCWKVAKKTLSERMHHCDCGCILTRDQNGARVNLRWTLSNLGQELARNAIPYPLAGWVA